MFTTPELATFIVETPLRNAPRLDGEPHVIRFVLSSTVLAIRRVRLSKPAIVIVTLNLFDVRRTLTFEILLNKCLERLDILERFTRWCVARGSNAEQVQDLSVRLFGEDA
jgi:hypothetical protein